MKRVSRVVLGSLVAGMLAFGTVPVLAGEHGGGDVQEHGGSAMGMKEGSHGMEMGEAAILKQAAMELKASNPELAQKLEDMAKKHEM